LDVGTGGADIPAALSTSFRATGFPLDLYGVDRSGEILRHAAIGSPGISLAVAKGESLPFADGTFDATMCSLMLHHLSPSQAVEVLQEMRRVARRGVVINDLVRSLPGLWGAWLFGHLCTANALTRHDAPLSVRRAYSRTEILGLLHQASLEPIHMETRWFRVGIAARPAP
ncbi:MAG TPA: methyltransferase domain-containing protein, partial [Chloroflexota bacterium]